MGVASKAISFVSRFMALASSVIVAGLLGRFMRHLHNLGFGGGSKVIYALSLAGISTFFALLLLAPFAFSFWAFPLDLAMFVMWIVAFALLTNLSPNCGGWWHTWIWRFSWGSSRCNIWRTILAFSFIAAMMWLLNALLGMYRTWKDRKGEGAAAGEQHQRSGGLRDRILGKKGGTGNQPMAETGQPHQGAAAAAQNGENV